MATGKKAGKHAQSSNDFLSPSKPIISSVTTSGIGRPYNNGQVFVAFALPENSPPAVSYLASGYDSTSDTIKTAIGTSSPITVEGFGSNSTTDISVIATNIYGDSVSSDSVTSPIITTVPAKPGPPIATAQTNQDYVEWSAPANGGSAITGYTLLSSDGPTYSTLSLNYTLSETGNTSQTYTVKATNSNGDSYYSNSSNQVTTVFSPPSFFAPPGFFAPPIFFQPPGFPPYFPPFFPPSFYKGPSFPPIFFAPPGFKGKCLAPDSLVYASSGWIKAKDVSIGDALVTISNDFIDLQSISENRTSPSISGSVQFVQTFVKSVEYKMSKLVGFNNLGKNFSTEHPIFIKCENGITYKNSEDIQIGDILIGIGPDAIITETVVTSVEIDENESGVYDIRTEGNPWFIVNSTLTIA